MSKTVKIIIGVVVAMGLAFGIAVIVLISAFSGSVKGVFEETKEAKDVARAFTEEMASEDYAGALALGSSEFAQVATAEQLEAIGDQEQILAVYESVVFDSVDISTDETGVKFVSLSGTIYGSTGATNTIYVELVEEVVNGEETFRVQFWSLDPADVPADDSWDDTSF